MQGKAHGRQGALRMDVESPRGPLSVLIDWDKHQLTMLMHPMKMMMQRDTTQDSDIPRLRLQGHGRVPRRPRLQEDGDGDDQRPPLRPL